jgi:mannitol 2-dehydrogenase
MEQNGHVLQKALIAFCASYDIELANWIEKNVSFPSCMVDRITPMTTDEDRKSIQQNYAIDDAYPVVCEPFTQWVIEDNFCNDRPIFEKVGIQFTNNVALYEKMKIRLLNATHSAMGYLGYLYGHRFIYEIAQDANFAPYLKNMMDLEVTPLLQTVEGVDFTQYKQILMQRFENENIKDQALRICMDGSGKIPKYILPSIIEQLKMHGEKANIRRLTLCVASWIRFLNGKDELGNDIPLVDPQAQRLSAISKQCLSNPLPMLECRDIFGDLIECNYFVKELSLLLDMLYTKGSKYTLEFCQ